MRNRKSSLLLFISLIAVLATGCSDQPTPSAPDADANQKVAVEAPTAKGKTPPKKPKDFRKFVGPGKVTD
jgi:hypothetical protein